MGTFISNIKNTFINVSFGCLTAAERARLTHLKWFLMNFIMKERTLPPGGVEMKGGEAPEATPISNIRRTYVKRFVFVAHPIIENDKFKGITDGDKLTEHHQKMIDT